MAVLSECHNIILVFSRERGRATQPEKDLVDLDLWSKTIDKAGRPRLMEGIIGWKAVLFPFISCMAISLYI